jgi:hypothetical protein
MCALRAIAAVFRTAAGLDGEQAAHLHLVGRMKPAMNRLRLHKQVKQRLVIDGGDFFAGHILAIKLAISN